MESREPVPDCRYIRRRRKEGSVGRGVHDSTHIFSLDAFGARDWTLHSAWFAPEVGAIGFGCREM
jgi:hypothetical protein